MTRKIFILTFFTVALIINLTAQHQLPDVNIYWPGNFEQSLYGGNFSRARGVEISDSQNHTPDGNRSWFLAPGKYQHIELLTYGKGKYRVKFYARSLEVLPVVVKEVVKTGEKEHKTEEYTLNLESDGMWHKYQVEFDVQKPYPGPETGEVLITCYNGNEAGAWIDDLELIRISTTPQSFEMVPNPAFCVTAVINGTFDFGSQAWEIAGTSEPIDENAIVDVGNYGNVLALNVKGVENAIPSAAQIIDATKLAGKTIRLSCDVGFKSITDDANSWAGIVVTLKKGKDSSGKLIPGQPTPHWCVLGHAPPPGKLKTIFSVYEIPENAKNLFVEISAQKGMEQNVGVVDNVQLEILP